MPTLSDALMRRLVRESRVGRLATVDPDGRPNVVPFVFALDGETLYSSVDRKPKATFELRRLANIRERPNAATVLVDHFSEDWEELWWVRIRAGGRILDEGAERERAIRALEENYAQYERGALADQTLFALDAVSWRGWSWRRLQ